MNPNPQVDLARRLLTEMAGLAEHASMTGSLRGGEKTAALTFNRALDLLAGQGAIPDGMFEPVDPQSADYSVIGVQSRLLLSVIAEEPQERRRRRDREGDEHGGLGAVVALAPFLDSNDLAAMIRERIDDAAEVSDGLLTALAPFLDSHALGDLVRRRVRPAATPKAPTPPEPPAPPVTPTPEPPVDLPPVDLRPVVPASTTLESLAAELRRPDLTADERQRIATRLAEIAFEQSSGG